MAQPASYPSIPFPPGCIAADGPMSRIFLSSVVFLLICLIFVSGCVHVSTETTLFVAKITPEGKLAWITVIDSGKNGVGTNGMNLTEMPGGNIMIQGDFTRSGCGMTPSAIRPNRIRISPQGSIQSIENRTGGFIGIGSYNNTFTDNGSHLVAYEKAMVGARYFRIQKIDAEGEILWDVPFLTLKNAGPPKDTWDTILIHGIIPASDKGYIVWGHRERTTPC